MPVLWIDLLPTVKQNLWNTLGMSRAIPQLLCNNYRADIIWKSNTSHSMIELLKFTGNHVAT
jgi:hypothetical protein